MKALLTAAAHGRAGLLALVLASIWPGAGASAAPDQPVDDGIAFTVDGISASSGEDNPRVLYILPWQAPSLPRRPRADLENRAPELVQPIDPAALERHRVFRRTLNPSALNPGPDSVLTTQ